MLPKRFTSRFTHTTFEDEMKWYSNEPTQGKEDYSISDSLMALMKQHNIAVRGHNVLWDDPRFQPSWVPSLESKLGPSASSTFYKMASDIDSFVPLFMNEYNTLEEKGDTASTPDKYLAKLKEIKCVLGPKANQMAIGLECHFDVPNLPYVRSSLDTLASKKLPIWLTEIVVKSNPNQATFLEQVFREGHEHPGVSGMIIWSAWKPEGCYHMCLTDNNFKNLATGEVVDKLLKEWGIKATLQGQTDANGFFEASLFHGEYEVKISLPVDAANTSLSKRFNVEPAHESQDQVMLLQVST
ncbi:DNA polymerase kappa-like [Hibiscus syriacus]|uniref:DNA polymerase kappa-like n=1 Tax=Hibiscus syriacus TaxID=106335 RepID=A0A6A3AUP3_HIBSY|nr:DNA polymerase kappa-like [Hibiscus syriacus]